MKTVGDMMEPGLLEEGLVCGSIFIKEIKSWKARLLIKQYYKQQRAFETGQHKPDSLNLLFEVVEYFDRFVFFTPVVFFNSKSDQKDRVEVSVIGDKRCYLEVNLNLRFDFSRTSVLLCRDQPDRCTIWHQERPAQQESKYVFGSKQSLLANGSDKGAIESHMRVEGVDRLFADKDTEALRFSFQHKSVDIESERLFLRKSDLLELPDYNCFLWLVRCCQLPLVSLLRVHRKVNRRFKQLSFVRLFVGMVRLQFRHLASLKTFKISTDFLSEYLNGILFWLSKDPSKLEDVLFPSFCCLYFEAIFVLNWRPKFGMVSKLGKVISAAKQRRDLVLVAIEHEFKMRFDKATFDRHNDSTLADFDVKLSANWTDLTVFMSHSPERWVYCTIHRLSVSNPKCWTAESLLFEGSMASQASLRRCFETVSALECFSPRITEDIRVNWHLHCFSGSRGLVGRELLFRRKTVFLMGKLRQLQDHLTRETGKGPEGELEGGFYKQLMVALSRFMLSQYGQDTNSGEVMHYLGLIALAKETDLRELATIEELFTQNYVDLRRIKKAIATSGLDQNFSLHKSLKIEQSLFKPDSDLIARLTILTNALFVAEYRLVQLQHPDDLKSLGLYRWGVNSVEDQVMLKSEADRGGEGGNDTNDSKAIPDWSFQQHPFDSANQASNASFRSTKEQRVLTFGYNNFGQLGFPKDAFGQKHSPKPQSVPDKVFVAQANASIARAHSQTLFGLRQLLGVIRQRVS